MEGEKIDIKFTKTLRPDQVPLVEDFISKIGKDRGALGGTFSAPCGTGKTIMTMKFLAHLGRPAIILVHTEALMKQWREAILGNENTTPPRPAFTDVRSWEVGVIQQDTCEWYGKKIVLAMVESLISREYDPAMYRYFGVLVADEVHRHAGAAWHKALTLFPARIRIGLSATPRRADGLWDVIRWHIGDVLTKGGEWAMKPRVFRLQTGIAVESKFYIMRNGKMSLARLHNVLTQIEGRNMMIAGELVKSIRAGNRTLVLSSRREHLKELKRLFAEMWKTVTLSAEEAAALRLMGPEVDHDMPGVKIGYYVGGITEEQIDRSRTCNLLFGTLQYAKEGLDDPSVDTLFLTVPAGDIEQPCGRVLRKSEGKREPFVIDFVDERTKVCYNFGMSRLNQYKRLGFTITDVALSLPVSNPS